MTRYSRKGRLFGVLLALLLGAGAPPAAAGPPGGAQHSEASSSTDSEGLPRGYPGAHGAVVRRTSYGIPHVLAADYRGLGLGLGYAFAKDNACVLADIVLTLAGERSRWFGPDAEAPDGTRNLVSDLYHRQINQRSVIERSLALPSPVGPSRQARNLVRGYAAGYNRYLAETGVANLPDACRGADWVRPITELDVWRRAHQVAELSAGESAQDLIVSAQPPGASVPGPDTARAAAAADRLLRSGEQASNAFGLGREATAGGTGMVLANPHFPWRPDLRFYQHHLTIPGELNVSGAALYGLPVVNIGHTDKLAWTHTSSTVEPLTVTRLTLADGDPTAYLVDGEVRQMSTQQVTVPVRQDDGRITRVTRTLYRTPDGPVLEIPEALEWSATTAYALHSANAGNLRVIDQWLAIGRSHDVAGLRAALARHQGIPWVNTIAADSTGTAYYGDIQVVPHVTDGLLKRCGTGPDIGLVILDGSRSSCDWGSDPDAVVPGLFGPDRLPSLTRHDQVSNMNDSPWLTNPAAPLTGYPAIIGSVGTPRSARTRLGLDMIADRLDGSDGLGKPGFTLRALQATMLGNRNLTAEQGRADVVAMCRSHPELPAGDGELVDVRKACAALAGWDGTGDTGESGRGAFLWRTFVEILRDLGPRSGEQISEVPFDPADPVHTPRGIDAETTVVRTAFADAVKQLDAQGIPVDVPLDTVQRYAGIPIHGCGSAEGCFNVVEAGSGPGGSRVVHGSTFIMAVELTEHGPRARTLLVYGQSADPASPHHTDQARRYADKKWVTGRFTEREILRDRDLTIRYLSGP